MIHVCYPGTTYPGHPYYLTNWVNMAAGRLANLSTGFYIAQSVGKGVYTFTVNSVQATFGVLEPTPNCVVTEAGPPVNSTPVSYPAHVSSGAIPFGFSVLTGIAILLIILALVAYRRTRGRL